MNGMPLKAGLISSMMLTASLGLEASEVTNIPQVGDHHRIFVFEKNENPQNIMVIYTQVDSGCRFLTDRTDGGKPTFDFYWLMERRSYKPVHPLIRGGIQERLEVNPTSDRQLFYVRINDLKEMQQDIQDPRLQVRSRAVDGRCQVTGSLTLGPSDGNRTIRLTSIYTEAKKTLLPPFRKPVSVTLNGVDVKTGQSVSRKYMAK